MKRTFVLRIGVLLALSLGWAPAAYSQTATGDISGRITDPSGAAIPGAAVTVTNTETGAVRKVESNMEGYYTVPLLRPGTYQLVVLKEGFQPAARSNMKLEVNQSLTQDVSLTVGTVTERIEIQAASDLIQASTAEMGTVVDSRPVVDLPLNGRNFTQLLILTPGVTPITTGQSGTIGTGILANTGIPGTTFSQPAVHGQWNRSNFYLLDGLNNSDWFGSTYAVLPIVDAIQEFKVQSHNDKAEYGGVLGGVVNIVTKSGSNSLHGSAWEFVRNDAFDARNPYTDATRTSPAPFRQNQFGLAVGGPVYIPKIYNGKNRSFFFFSYEGWRYRKPSQAFRRVPTDLELSGDFSQSTWLGRPIFNPFSTRPDPNHAGVFLRDPFANNVIPSNLINSMAQGWFQTYYDKPNLTGQAFYNNVVNFPTRNDNNTYMGRFDQRIGDKFTAWFRYTSMYPLVNAPLGVHINNVSDEQPKNYGGGGTYIFSPNLILDGRFGYSTRYFVNGNLPNDGFAGFQKLGFQGLDRYGVVDLIVQSPWSGYGLSGPSNNYQRNWNGSANLTWIKGNHSIKMGYTLYWLLYHCCAGPGYGQRNQYFFNNAQTGDPAQIGTTGASLASALIGVPGSIYFAAQNFIFRYPSWATYIQDEWKVTRKLTMTLGLRFDYHSTPHLTDGVTSALDPATGNWLIGGGKMPPACNTAGKAPCIPGDGNLANIPYGNKISLAPNPDFGPDPTRDNWGPRFGLAYRLTNNTVIRGGYGVVFDSLSGLIQTFQAQVGSWPDATNTQKAFNNIGDNIVTLSQLQTEAASVLPGPTPWNATNWMYDPKLKNAYSHQWNIEIQRQVTDNLMVSIGYAGSRNRRMNITGQFNVSPYAGPGTATEVRKRRPFPWAVSTFMNKSIGEGSYNGLEFKADRRFSNGLQFLISYTWSKAMDNGSSGFFGVEDGPGGSSAIQNFYDIRGNRSVAAYDIPHYLSAAVTYQLPFGKGQRYLKRGPAAYVLGGWQINTITQARSGRPYNLTVIGDVANLGSDIGWWNYARPNLVGDPNPPTRTARQFYNPAAFAVPVYSFGNFGRNVLRGEPVFNMDLSLFKTVPIREGRQVEFRGEAFNTLNMLPLGIPDVNVNGGNAGRVSGVGNAPRVLQLGLKISF